MASGSTFTTYLKAAADTTWTLVDTTTDATYSSGGIGFRTGSTEQATFDDITVTDPNGSSLYSNDFSDHRTPTSAAAPSPAPPWSSAPARTAAPDC